MKKKVSLISMFLVITFFLFIFLDILNQDKNAKEIWLVCDAPSRYVGYKETLKFQFLNMKLAKYYRVENFEPQNSEVKDNTLSYYEQTKETLSLDKYFDYVLEDNDENITITTFINTRRKANFYDKYMASFGINHSNDINDIQKILINFKYECEVKR